MLTIMDKLERINETSFKMICTIKHDGEWLERLSKKLTAYTMDGNSAKVKITTTNSVAKTVFFEVILEYPATKMDTPNKLNELFNVNKKLFTDFYDEQINF
jgi:hypothetical protein